MTEDEKKVLELARKWYAESGLKFTDELWFAVGQMCERERIRPTQRAADVRTADGACENCGNNCWKLVCETCGAE